MTNLEAAIKIQEGKIQTVREELKFCVNVVKSICDEVDKRLKNEMSEDGINALGELQSMGVRFDRACALLSERKDALKLLKGSEVI